MANQSSIGKWSNAVGVVSEKFKELQGNYRKLSIIGNATTAATAIGMAVPGTTGTATARNWASTNMLTQAKRLAYVTAAGGAGEQAELHGGVANIWRGNAPGVGGFAVKMQFGISDSTLSTSIAFVGLAATTSAIGTTVQGTAITDCVGVTKVSTSNNWHITWNKSSGTGTKIDLGSDFLIATTDLITLELYCDKRDPSRAIHYSVINETNGACSRGIIPGDHATVPTLTTAMTYHFHRASNDLTAAVAIDVVDFVAYT